ncbi:isochorismatase family protein [Microbacterium jiangjiandongii]|uniref:isochorismatase family protein n=1 Tax=Microbacterium jiangjiandongii TaxID=3049071 RepID=UPI00214B4B1A|nr:isochorismatase family protein [Microbacterium sp. zg.Y843]MCR2816542.1 isochorismatase family protein [Microbacterium sp. zg.Y843]
MSDAFTAAGYGARPVGFGRKTAVVVVDFQLGFTGGTNPMAQSPHVGAAVARASEVLADLRALDVPVLHTFVAYRGDWELGYWKAAGSLSAFTPDSDLAQVDPRVLAPTDAVVEKRFPSAFFGTDVASILRYWDVDTVVVMGCTSSGCVRASIIDSFSYGFRTIVAEDCCGDQDAQAHADNMRDVGRRYADVLSGEEIIAHLSAAAAPAG